MNGDICSFRAFVSSSCVCNLSCISFPLAQGVWRRRRGIGTWHFLLDPGSPEVQPLDSRSGRWTPLGVGRLAKPRCWEPGCLRWGWKRGWAGCLHLPGVQGGRGGQSWSLRAWLCFFAYDVVRFYNNSKALVKASALTWFKARLSSAPPQGVSVMVSIAAEDGVGA